MPTRPFRFLNSEDVELVGRLEVPVGRARAWAVFAHCFTCGKDSLAAVRIARRLAGVGIGVLRFDFPGLGQSAGEFENSTFRQNVRDVVDACEAMAGAAMEVELLVGHSLGGAAVMAAASGVATVKAVATVAAPYLATDVLRQLSAETISQARERGSAVTHVGGRTLTIGRAFLEDLPTHDQGERIGGLGRPLLLLHSPTDEMVPISNVTDIYLAAKHPKSFISLDGADHLLTREVDAFFAADMIGAWADRYVTSPYPTSVSNFDAEAEETGLGKFQLSMRAGKAAFIADEPESVGGLGSGPTPYNLISAALAACTTMTLRLHASKKGMAVRRLRTGVRHRKDKQAAHPDIFNRTIEIDGRLSPADREDLLLAAERCPVHRTLEKGVRFDPPRLMDDRDRQLTHPMQEGQA